MRHLLFVILFVSSLPAGMVQGRSLDDGPVSEEISTLSDTEPTSPPRAPVRLVATSTSATSIHLGWPFVFNTTGFLIERRLASELNWTQVATVEGVLSYRDTTVIAGESYYYRITAFNEAGNSPVVESSTVVKAQVMPLVMDEDFDPEIDVSVWHNFYMFAPYIPEVRNIAVGGNGTNILWFGYNSNQGGLSKRSVATRSFDVSGGGIISFNIRAGNTERDGSTDWESSEAGKTVALAYSNSSTQGTIATFDVSDPLFSDWQYRSYVIPAEARTPATHFYWSQSGSSGDREDTWALDNVKVQGVADDTLRITRQLSSGVTEEGTNWSLAVSVNKSETSYQWFKDGEAIFGETKDYYNIQKVQPSDAGRYYCQISDGVSLIQTDTVTRFVIKKQFSPKPLKVALGGAFTLGMDVYPADRASEVTFTWAKSGGGSLQGIGNVTGANTATLTVSDATAAAMGDYQCSIGYPGGTRNILYTVQPLPVPEIQPIPTTKVIAGQAVEFPVAITDAASVRVSGLPAGLRYDSESGRILGNTHALKNYTIKVEAENATGVSEPFTFELNIIPYPQTLAGKFHGVLLNGAEAPYKHGGQVALQITPKGVASGTVLLRGKVHRLVSVINVAEVNGEEGALEATFKDQDGDTLTLQAAMSSSLGEVTLTRNTEVVPFLNGYVVKSPWSVKNPAPGVGLINVALPPIMGDAPASSAVPGKTGFLNLKLGVNGAVTVKGRLADGRAVTGAALMGAAGDIPVFVTPYKHQGAVTSLIHYAGSEVSGTAYWSKADQGPKSKDRAYKAGFARQVLDILGGLYVRPAANGGWPSFPALAPQAELAFRDGGLVEPISQTVSFDRKYRPALPRPSAENPQGVTLKLNVATGVFTGSFKIEDENPENPNKPLIRTVLYYGSLIPGMEKGMGFFLLPDLPSAEVPKSTLKNTPQWSGQVELRALAE